MRTSGSRLLIACFVLTTRMTLAAEEPTAQIATTWWPDLTNVVTPVAWRDHPHRFNVIYNGTVLAIPHPQQVLRFDWSAERLQIFWEEPAPQVLAAADQEHARRDSDDGWLEPEEFDGSVAARAGWLAGTSGRIG